MYLVPPVCQEPITAMFRASHLLDCGANSQDREKAMKEEEEEDGSHIFFSDDDDAKPIIPQKKRKKMATSGKGLTLCSSLRAIFSLSYKPFLFLFTLFLNSTNRQSRRL